MKTPSHRLTPAQAEALEARFALRLSARLDDGAQVLPHDISERLRVARMQAVHAARAAASRTATQLSPARAPVAQVGLVLAGSGTGNRGVRTVMPGQSRDVDHGRRLDDAPTGWGWRLASALPVLALVVGLWGIHHWNKHEQVQAAADVDMALLSDELPPSAYTDPGFEEFMRASLSDEGGHDPSNDAPALPIDMDASPAPVQS